MAAGRRRTVLSEFAGRVRVTRKSFLLLPGDGQRPAYDEYVIRHRIAAAERAPELGFSIPELGHPYPRSSLPAQRLALRVQSTTPERLDALEDALFRAVFTDLADVADADILRGCARAAGVSEDEVARALSDDSLAEQAHREHFEAMDLGIEGIPALWITGQQALVGAVPVESYRRALEAATKA